jgi:hypothetical protein
MHEIFYVGHSFRSHSCPGLNLLGIFWVFISLLLQLEKEFSPQARFYEMNEAYCDGLELGLSAKPKVNF